MIKMSKERDREKRQACKKQNITLIEVPYWWDMRKESLLALLEARCPNLKIPK